MKRFLLGLVAVVSAVSAYAGTINVTSPAKGTAQAPTLVGGSTSINFGLTNMVNVAKINIKVVRLTDNVTILDQKDALRVTPSTTNKDGSGTYNLTFAEGAAEVAYRVEVRAEDLNNATAYNTDQDLFVKPDLTKPKILSFNPVNNAFVKGVVPIRVRISEANLQDWRVQVNNQDIPNNAGTTVNANGEFVVNWDTTGIVLDGAKTISIRIRDEAGNEENRNLTVTLDRIAPVATIRAPVNNTTFSAGTTIVITVDIKDASSSSVNVTGIDVVARTTGNAFITRAARLSFTALDATTNRWTGRIRWQAGLLPGTFKIVVTAVDRAGNVSPTPQTVTVKIGS